MLISALCFFSELVRVCNRDTGICFLALSFLTKIGSRTAVAFGWFFLLRAEVSQSFLGLRTAFHVLHPCRLFGTRTFRRPSLFANTNVLYFGRCAFFCSALESLCQTKLFLSRFLAKKFLLRLIAALRGLHACVNPLHLVRSAYLSTGEERRANASSLPHAFYTL